MLPALNAGVVNYVFKPVCVYSPVSAKIRAALFALSELKWFNIAHFGIL